MLKSTLLAAVLFSLLGCDDSGGIYTLYRSSPNIWNIQGDKVRIHVATSTRQRAVRNTIEATAR